MYAAMPHAFHAAEATGVATCMRKPLVATCSLDRTLRLWNYQDWCAPPLGAPAWPAALPLGNVPDPGRMASLQVMDCDMVQLSSMGGRQA